jgi:hypothetical protein
LSAAKRAEYQMFSSTILDVVVGLIFTFLAVSTVTEAIAQILNWGA